MTLKNEKPTITTVAKINNTEIVVIENGEKRVAVKPICEALGVAFEPQFTKLKTDPILSSVVMLIVTTGSDGKQYEMVTIPFKFVFGWLFRIDSRNVKEDARESVLRYQMECYESLYRHFTLQSDYLKARQDAIDAQLEEVDRRRKDFREYESRYYEARREFDRLRSVTFSQWLADQSQLSMFTTEEMEG